MILVDSDVIIDFFAGTQPSADLLARLLVKHEALISSVSVFEILAGVTGKKRLRQIEELLSIVPVIDFNRLAAEKAAEIYTKLKKKGSLVGNQDIFLAATASCAGIPVLTRNVQHFKRISGVDVLRPKDFEQ